MVEYKSRDWLKRLRRSVHLTQSEAASKANVKRTTWASIEQGQRAPSVGTAKKIAQALDFEWTIFFTD